MRTTNFPMPRSAEPGILTTFFKAEGVCALGVEEVTECMSSVSRLLCEKRLSLVGVSEWRAGMESSDGVDAMYGSEGEAAS